MAHREHILKTAFYAALTTIFVLALIPETEELPEVTRISDKLNHIAAFAVLSLLIDLAYTQKALLWKISFLLLYGFVIECVQFFIPYREFSLVDLSIDALGVAGYFAARALLARLGYHHARQ